MTGLVSSGDSDLSQYMTILVVMSRGDRSRRQRDYLALPNRDFSPRYAPFEMILVMYCVSSLI